MFKIVSKQKIAPKEFDMWVEAPRIAGHAKAGQFVVLRVNDMGERIPLTIADHDEEKGQIRLVFQVVGKTTAALSHLEPGEAILDISGPLGTPSEVEKYGTVLMVGGGVGIAALYPIIKALKQQGNKVITILGGRTSSLVVMKDECAKYSDELIVTTDDGSEGMKGVVTDAMKMVVERGEVRHEGREGARPADLGLAQPAHGRRHGNVRLLPRHRRRQNILRLRRRPRVRRTQGQLGRVHEPYAPVQGRREDFDGQVH